MSRFAESARALREEAILAAASNVAARRGWGYVTMNEIASEAGVAKGTLYLHFSSKETLLASLVDRARRDLMVPTRRQASGTGHHIDRLRAIYATIAAARRQTPILAQLMHGCPCYAESGCTAGSLLVEELAQCVGGLIADGQAHGAVWPQVDAVKAAVALLVLAMAPPGAEEPGSAESSGAAIWPLYERALRA